MADPVLSAVLSGKKAVLLSWTFPSNADFQVFWKSNIPAGQVPSILGSTNAFSYTTGNLESNKVYSFYVRANVGATFFYSNVVELFVSCGRGVVLSVDTPEPPPAQLPDVVLWLTRPPWGIWKYDLKTDTLTYVSGTDTLGNGIGITVAANGDVYAVIQWEDIYKSIGGTGLFTGTGQGYLDSWTKCASDPNGDVFVTRYYQDIWRKRPTDALFLAYDATTWNPWPVSVDKDGNLWTANTIGEIYKAPRGGAFVLYATPFADEIRGIAVGNDGSVYVSTRNSGSEQWGRIYRQEGGSGAFVPCDLPIPDYYKFETIVVDNQGSIYVVAGTDTGQAGIWRQYRGSGAFVTIPTLDLQFYDVSTNRWNK
jgi:hypothetical protein